MISPQYIPICHYRYDPLDRLASQTQADTPPRQRFYCKSRLATEIQGTIGHSIVQHDNLLLAQHQRQNGVLDSTLLATDLQRSVLNTLKSGRQPQTIAYSPYGHRPVESGLSSLLGFNGERPDPVTGHYLLGNGYRAFNPVLMRFNSPDSLSPFGKGGLNAYAYCMVDPINNTDPNGHIRIPNIFKFLSKLKAPKKIISNKKMTKLIKQINSDEKTIKGAMIANADTVEVINKNTHLVFKKNPSLFELAYSKVEGKDLKLLEENLAFPQTNPNLNHYNLHNIKELAGQKLGIHTSLDFRKSVILSDQINHLASKGKVHGVNPRLANEAIENNKRIRKIYGY